MSTIASNEVVDGSNTQQKPQSPQQRSEDFSSLQQQQQLSSSPQEQQPQQTPPQEQQQKHQPQQEQPQEYECQNGNEASDQFDSVNGASNNDEHQGFTTLDQDRMFTAATEQFNTDQGRTTTGLNGGEYPSAAASSSSFTTVSSSSSSSSDDLKSSSKSTTAATTVTVTGREYPRLTTTGREYSTDEHGNRDDGQYNPNGPNDQYHDDRNHYNNNNSHGNNSYDNEPRDDIYNSNEPRGDRQYNSGSHNQEHGNYLQNDPNHNNYRQKDPNSPSNYPQNDINNNNYGNDYPTYPPDDQLLPPLVPLDDDPSHQEVVFQHHPNPLVSQRPYPTRALVPAYSGSNLNQNSGNYSGSNLDQNAAHYSNSNPNPITAPPRPTHNKKVVVATEGAWDTPGRLYISRIGSNTSCEDLQNFFEQYGFVTDITFPRHSTLTCFVQYRSHLDAVRCIQANPNGGQLPNGTVIIVKPALSKASHASLMANPGSSSSSFSSSSSHSSVPGLGGNRKYTELKPPPFSSNYSSMVQLKLISVPKSLDRRDLYLFYGRFGPIESIKFTTGVETKTGKQQLAYIIFTSQHDAHRALAYNSSDHPNDVPPYNMSLDHLDGVASDIMNQIQKFRDDFKHDYNEQHSDALRNQIFNKGSFHKITTSLPPIKVQYSQLPTDVAERQLKGEYKALTTWDMPILSTDPATGKKIVVNEHAIYTHVPPGHPGHRPPITALNYQAQHGHHQGHLVHQGQQLHAHSGHQDQQSHVHPGHNSGQQVHIAHHPHLVQPIHPGHQSGYQGQSRSGRFQPPQQPQMGQGTPRDGPVVHHGVGPLQSHSAAHHSHSATHQSARLLSAGPHHPPHQPHLAPSHHHYQKGHDEGYYQPNGPSYQSNAPNQSNYQSNTPKQPYNVAPVTNGQVMAPPRPRLEDYQPPSHQHSRQGQGHDDYQASVQSGHSLKRHEDYHPQQGRPHFERHDEYQVPIQAPPRPRVDEYQARRDDYRAPVHVERGGANDHFQQQPLKDHDGYYQQPQQHYEQQRYPQEHSGFDRRYNNASVRYDEGHYNDQAVANVDRYPQVIANVDRYPPQQPQGDRYPQQQQQKRYPQQYEQEYQHPQRAYYDEHERIENGQRDRDRNYDGYQY